MIQIHEGDCLDVMRQMALSGIRVDAFVTDSPYHLTSITKRFGGDRSAEAQFGRDGAFNRLSRGFMGRTWDGGDVAQRVEVWRAAYRLLKPGGWLLAMSGTRTQHRMVCAIEDAGFEIRDQIGWLYAQGFAKNRKARGGSVGLAPAWEPICVARKPLGERTLEANMDRWGVGVLNTEACRIPLVGATDPRLGGRGTWSTKNAAKNVYGDFAGIEVASSPEGRFPKNIITDGSDVVRALFPDSRGQSGDVRGTEPSYNTRGIYGRFSGRPESRRRQETDASAARFFYAAKATRAERAFEHPTVKPRSLMRYLVRLVTWPGAIVCDPFAGTGQTGHAALLEGRSAILIEKEPDYAEGLRRRFEGRISRRPVLSDIECRVIDRGDEAEFWPAGDDRPELALAG